MRWHRRPDKGAPLVNLQRMALLVLLILAVYAAGWMCLMPPVAEPVEVERLVVVQVLVPAQLPVDEPEVVRAPAVIAERSGTAWTGVTSVTGPTLEDGAGDVLVGLEEKVVPAREAEELEPLMEELERASIEAPVERAVAAKEPVVFYRPAAVFDGGTGISILPAEVPAANGARWWELRDNLGAGIRYGVALGNGEPKGTGTAYGFWEFLRVKDAFFTGYVEGNTDRLGKAQVDMQWRKR